MTNTPRTVSRKSAKQTRMPARLRREQEEYNVAAIDIGTNSIHLVIARIDTSGYIRILDIDKVSVRLGNYIDKKGMLTAEGINRAISALRVMRGIADSYDCKIRALATHAVRVASNYREFIRRVKAKTGISVDLIDGHEEARLMFQGIRYGFDVEQQPCLAIDIGGGSTEIIVGKGDHVNYVTSLKIGAVTLTKAHLKDGTWSKKKIQKLNDQIQDEVAPIMAEVRHLPRRLAIATSGTAKAVAALDARLSGISYLADLNGYLLSAKAINDITTALGKCKNAKEVKDTFGIDQDRAEIILAGALVLRALTKLLRIKQWCISSFGLREGILVDIHRRHFGYRFDDMRSDRWGSVYEFGKRLDISHKASMHVAYLAHDVFNQVSPKILKGLSGDDRQGASEIVKLAAYLRESGRILSYTKYHKHSNYLISNARLLGFTQHELELAGLAAQYHRKGRADGEQEECRGLDAKEIKLVNVIAGSVRLASLLDYSRSAKVRQVKILVRGKRLTVMLSGSARARAKEEIRRVATEAEGLGKMFGLIVNVHGVTA